MTRRKSVSLAELREMTPGDKTRILTELAQEARESGPKSPIRKVFEKLDVLIHLARQHEMTPEERRTQMINFVYGNIGLSNPDVTLEMCEREYDKMHPREK